MGGSVGIEAAKLEALDYETVKASGLAFGTAHNVLQRSLTKAKSINASNDQTSIHFLAIRQLSHNLKNQKVLEKTRHKVLKTKSVPHNVKYRQHSFEYEAHENPAEGDGEGEGDLNHDDLDLVHDEDFYDHHHATAPSALLDDGPPWNFSEKGHTEHHAGDHRKEHASGTHMDHKDEGKGADDDPQPAHITAPTATAASKPKKPRPNLCLQLTSDVSNNALPIDVTVNNNVNQHHPFKHSNSKSQQHHDHETTGGVGGVGGTSTGTALKHPPSPSANVRVSPRGTLYMGKWKVMETGIFPDESLANSHRRPNQGKNHSINGSIDKLGGANSHAPARSHMPGSSGHNLHSLHKAGSLSASSNNNSGYSLHKLGSSHLAPGSFRKQPALPAIGGKRDFLEINTLGSGASGVVSEAIHLPSLTIVALKMLPVYNQEKRQHVSRELGVLYKNLAELRLVDESLYGEAGPGDGAAGEEKSGDQHASTDKDKDAGKVLGLGGVSSPHILSLYNAFVDPKSGMINLVIEYMDGGSLEDLVQQGGCRDEKVLADIAYQTVKGLCFLHSNKNVHRDIKPANILCSTSGLIKIGDFGIAKALDKTSGFANSFVGTVSYMSPERITGEHYSFTCDIWSLGLTLLAVAKGRFPLSSKEKADDSGTNSESISESSSPAGIVGGAAGYWAMIKAICDDEPPKAGPFFSKDFNDFIAACLKKDPTARSSAKQLLSTPFIENNASSLKLSFSDLQMRRKTSGTNDQPSLQTLQAVTAALPASQEKLFPQTSSREDSFDMDAKEGSPHRLAIETSLASDTSVIPSAPSPLTTRLTNAAIVRRTSKEFPVFDSPTNLMHKALAEADSKAAQQDTVTTTNAGGLTISAKITIREDVEEEDMQYIDGAKKAHDVIISIRLEHLDRVLDRIAHKLGNNNRRMGSSSFDYNGEDAGDGGEEEEYDDTQDHDLADVHHYTDEFAAVSNDPMLEGHDSVDSMDKLLQFNHGEPSPPPLQLPNAKFPAHRKPAEQAEMVADVKLVSHNYDHGAVPLGHKGEVGDKGASSDDKKGTDTRPDEKHSTHHSILKGSTTHDSHHGHHLHYEDGSSIDAGLMKADEKKAIFQNKNGGTSAFNSNRSVHFTDGDEPLPSLSLAKKGVSHGATGRGRHDADGNSMHDGDGEDDADEAASSALSHPSLPKTSSYFVQSRFQQLHNGHRLDVKDVCEGERDGDADSDENDTLAVVDHAIAVSEAVSQSVVDGPPAPGVDYRRMLPKLNERGLPKWENLAKQLHLPLHLVKMAVRSRLGHLVDLEAESDDERGADDEEEYMLGEEQQPPLEFPDEN